MADLGVQFLYFFPTSLIIVGGGLAELLIFIYGERTEININSKISSSYDG